MRVLVVGAGITGAVIARKLAENGHFISVIDQRNHVGGNCHTNRCEKTGVLEHVYGPHIFHTNDLEVFTFLSNHGEFEDYRHSVKALQNNSVYSLPINLHTINQFFGKTFNPEEAKDFIAKRGDRSIPDDGSFESLGRRTLGNELYEAFFKGYTEKQWGRSASEIPGFIFNRLPVRFNYDDNYFYHDKQAIPKHGYTEIVKSILDHINIEVQLNQFFERSLLNDYSHCFFSGRLDQFFEFKYGHLPYRTLKFERVVSKTDIQGTSVINYCDTKVPYTRITEFKYFSKSPTKGSIAYREFSSECRPEDIPYYPVKTLHKNDRLKKYLELVGGEANVTFVGRLGSHRYLDMDQAIRAALDTADSFIKVKRP